MLADSKVRQAGFIRNSSSRKIIYQPEMEDKNSQSDDSFSSFEYENNSKVSIKSVQKQENKNSRSHQKLVKLPKKQIIKTLTPHIPKPVKKPSQPQQPQFQNQRLKNDFFQQYTCQKVENLQRIKQVFPRTNTPQFNEGSIKMELQEVNSICNRIGGMKLEANFSFNPKVNNKFTKQNGIKEKLELESDQEGDQGGNRDKNNKGSLVGSKGNIMVGRVPPKKFRQNNYFSNNGNNGGNKFQYDFRSSSDEQQVESSQFDGNQQCEDQVQNQAIKYYQEQQRKRKQPEIFTKTQPKITPGMKKVDAVQNLQENYPINSCIQQKYQDIAECYQTNRRNPSLKQVSSKVQNEESASSQNDQELITEYKKDDFGMNIAEQMRGKKKQLTENRAYQNIPEPQGQEGMIATNGGVCFSVDVKQFSQNQSVGNHVRAKKSVQGSKKKKVNQKEQILKRRQMAKIYSKQSRFRLFGFS